MIIDRKSTYLSYILNSVGSKTYRNLYFRAGNYKKDITKNGELSCAVYVSSLLYLFDLIDKPHATIKSTVKNMVKFGWKEVKLPKKGDVLVWNYEKGHMHIGFYINRKRAISNSEKKRKVVEHQLTYNNKREIIKILRHTRL